ncbi:capsid cement protein [uncultured Sulfitobacter sp.]|uniref:capsid cement protein n=1 Tax=uncultured Sulfitobacter sp. TaxID=191468 RepID=UPI002593D12C|nr:capsid cement protein [uncultured Sulfitobacter sp.]
MRTYHSILSLTATMTAVCDAGDLIGFDDAPITADDAPVKGVAQNPATEIGLDIALTAIGFETQIASGVIAVGDKLVSAAAGGVMAAGVDPANVFATALTAAADGDLVQILIR